MAKGTFRGGALGGGNQMNMIKQAQKMQADLLRAQAELEEKRYTAAVGGGAVSATVSGKHELVALEIQPDAVDPEDVEMLQDLVTAAVNGALAAAEAEMVKVMGRFTGGMSLPGLF
jgi:DNA-binding YbaB/EbfC family protein